MDINVDSPQTRVWKAEETAVTIGTKDGTRLAETVDLEVFFDPNDLPDPGSNKWDEEYSMYDLATDCGLQPTDWDITDVLDNLAEWYADAHWYAYWETLFARIAERNRIL